MATHDYVIDNQSAPAFRSDLNNVLQAIVTQNSSAAAPTTTYPDMIWYDTAANQIKKRNEANSAWITLGTIDEVGGTFTPNALITTSQINPTTLVTASETIAANNNDTTLPTSAAVKSYTDTALAGAASVTLLGTITTTSGTTQTLSGLNLTSYRFVRFVFDGINSSASSGTHFFSVVGASVYSRTFGSSILGNLAGVRGSAEIDLFTGVGTGDGAELVLAAPTSIGSTSTVLRTSTTTASTSVSVSMTPSFTAGSVRVYGIR